MQLKISAFLLVIAAANGQVILQPGYGGRLAYGNAPLAYAPAPLALARAPVALARAPVALARAPIGIASQLALTRGDEDYDPNPQYDYSYSVDDPETGDSKSAQESRNGDVVQGSYSLIEPDGSRRIVEYTADPASGFNAEVRKEAGGVAVARPALAPAPIALAPAPLIGRRRILAPGLASRQILSAASPALLSSAYASPYAQYVL